MHDKFQPLYLITTLFLFLILNSCAPSKEKEAVALVPANILKLPVDYRTDIINRCTFIFKDDSLGREIIACQNKNKPAIEFYDIEKKAKIYEVPLEKEGANGIGKIQGFHVINSDSMVINNSTYQVYLINNKGKILRAYRLPDNQNFEGTSWPKILSGAPAFIADNQINIMAYPDFPPYEEGLINIRLNLKTGDHVSEYSFPKIYHEYNWDIITNIFSRTITPKGLFVYSFAVTPFIYVTDHDSLNHKIYAGSEEFDEMIPLPPAYVEDNPALIKHIVENNFYWNIIYDKYREVYYRMALHGINRTAIDGTLNNWVDKPISIIILNKHFKKIGETQLENNTYNYKNWFVGKEGLYLSNAHPKNPDIEENYMSFVCLKLKES